MFTEELDQVSESAVRYQRERHKPIPSRNHSAIQSRLIIALGKKYDTKYEFFSELSLNLPDVKPAVPDICIYLKKNWIY